MKKAIAVLLACAVGLPLLAWAAPAKLVFTTEPQTVLPGAVSSKLSIQVQDESGSTANVSETTHLSFETTSGSGEFSSSDNSWKTVATLTMSKGTANRSFYYKDAAAGTYTLTVRATDGQPWQPATQTIVIGETPAGQISGLGDSTSTASSSLDAESTGSGSSVVYSSHSSWTDLSSATDDPVKVGAGRPRLGAVGIPLEFRATANKHPYGMTFSWSFGDGSEEAGEEVRHAYSFPGTYEIVAHAFYGNGQEAVSRTKAKIVTPEVSIANVDGKERYVEVENKGEEELNLGGWKIACANREFPLPRDTILNGKSSVKIPLDVGLCGTGGEWRLVSPNGRLAGDAVRAGWIATTTLSELYQKAQLIAFELEKIRQARFAATPVLGRSATLGVREAEAVRPIELAAKVTASSLPPVANVIVLDREPVKPSWWSNLRKLFVR